MTNSTSNRSPAHQAVCDVCGSAPTLALADVRDPLSGERFDILRCPTCGLGRTSPMPANVGDYYGSLYYMHRHSFTRNFRARRRAKILDRATKGRAGMLLDIGCGEGSFLEAAAKRGYRIAGTEIGEAAHRAALAGIDVRSSLDDVQSLGPFDVITMWHTLEHFTSPSEVVERASSLLRDDGAFIVSVPNSQGLQAKLFGKDWFHFDVPRHLFHFGRQSLSALLERHHFDVLQWLHQELEYDMFGWMQSALNALMPEPNVLFQSLTGKGTAHAPAELVAHYALGTLMAPAALAATATGTVSGRGGTLVAVAKRKRRK
jgi:SAM-dependent methyltransferase